MYIWVYICNIYIHVYMHIHNLTKICLYIYLSLQQVQRKYQWAQCTQTDCLHRKIVPIRWKLTCLPDSSLICILLLIFSSVPVQLNNMISFFCVSPLTRILDSFSSLLLRSLAIMIILSIYCTFTPSPSATCHEYLNILTSLLS